MDASWCNFQSAESELECASCWPVPITFTFPFEHEQTPVVIVSNQRHSPVIVSIESRRGLTPPFTVNPMPALLVPFSKTIPAAFDDSAEPGNS